MTPLGNILARRIALSGPITVADYMAECLFHPEYGYYTTHEPFGASGDFVTAPEISQMFGELIGLWAADTWMRLGSPPSFVLAELGPGRGTMMADVLRATRIVPGFHQAAKVVLVEASPRLREKQKATLADYPVEWRSRFEELPEDPLLLLANEFFDALPIRQLVRTPEGIAERMVGLGEDGTLVWGLRPDAEPGALSSAPLSAHLAQSAEGSMLEICPSGLAIAAEIGARLSTSGGAALFIDYGHAGGLGDTLQALKSHSFDDPLAHPGEADITAHVDFAALASAALHAGARAFGPITQGALLERLGIESRAKRLKQNASNAQQAAIDAATTRLAGSAKGDMGELFKALALVHPVLDGVAGFAAQEAYSGGTP